MQNVAHVCSNFCGGRAGAPSSRVEWKRLLFTRKEEGKKRKKRKEPLFAEEVVADAAGNVKAISQRADTFGMKSRKTLGPSFAPGVAELTNAVSWVPPFCGPVLGGHID